MTTPPCAVEGGVVITPRAATSGTYYQLTRLDAATAQVTDAVVLPSSMRPLEAAYGPTGFSFAFDAIYNYGDGIKNLGTYVPASAVSVEAPAAVVATASGFDPAVFEELFIVASVAFVEGANDEVTATVAVAEGEKCPRCWNIRALGGNAAHPDVCERCGDALDAIGFEG